MTIFYNAKEMIMRTGYLTKINPVQIYHANCQEQLNKAFDIVAAEVEQEDDAYFQNYGTTMVEANYKVLIKLLKPSIVIGQNHVESNALFMYALRYHARISQVLILYVVPHVGHSRINTLSITKMSALVELAMGCSPENLRKKLCATILSYRASWET
eukprot:2585605-Ditylum_brightwellii.AAC.1